MSSPSQYQSRQRKSHSSSKVSRQPQSSIQTQQFSTSIEIGNGQPLRRAITESRQYHTARVKDFQRDTEPWSSVFQPTNNTVALDKENTSPYHTTRKYASKTSSIPTSFEAYACSLPREDLAVQDGSSTIREYFHSCPAETPKWTEDTDFGSYDCTWKHTYPSGNPEKNIEGLQVDFAGIGEQFDGVYARETEWQLECMM